MSSQNNWFSVLVTIFLFTCAICDKPTFENVQITAKNPKQGVFKVEPITGSLEPSKGIEEANEIKIKDQKIPILYSGAIKNLPRLYDLDLSGNEIEEIKQGAFQSVPNLITLKLNDNKLTTINEGVFNHLSLLNLNLAFNKIKLIEEKAFDDMPRLRVLTISHNEIKDWNPNWFKNSPRLLMIHFSHNLLEKLPANMLQNVKGLENMDDGWTTAENYFDFSDNKISYIDPKAFSGVKQLNVMDLRHNLITDLPQGLFSSLEKTNSIWLKGNQITCVSEESINTLPHGHGIKKWAFNLDSNPWNCTCLEKIQAWSTAHGSKLSIMGARLKCMTENFRKLYPKL